MNLSKIYKTFLIAQNGNASAIKLSRILNNQYSHDQITRFLKNSTYSNKSLWNAACSDPEFKKNLQNNDSVLIIDDTIIPKESRKENKQVCWHYDHSKNRVIKGIQFMTCLLSNKQNKIPVDQQIITKTDFYIDNKTKQKKRRSIRSKNEYSREMLNNVNSKVKGNYSHILSDSWFCSKQNIEYIDKTLKSKFILGIKSNRLIKLNDDTHTSTYKSLNKADIEPEKIYRIKLKGLDVPLILLKKVFKNGGKDKILSSYYISNDLDLEGNKLYKCYQKRWDVEEYHRFIKQSLSIGSSMSRTEKSQSNHIILSLICYIDLQRLSKSTNKSIHGLVCELLIESNKCSYDKLVKVQKSAA